MTYQDILDKVYELVQEHALTDKIDENDDFRSVGLDSLDAVELSFSLTNIYGIHLSDKEGDDIINLSVKTLTNLVCKKLGIALQPNIKPTIIVQNQIRLQSFDVIDKTINQIRQDSDMRTKILNKKLRTISK